MKNKTINTVLHNGVYIPDMSCVGIVGVDYGRNKSIHPRVVIVDDIYRDVPQFTIRKNLDKWCEELYNKKAGVDDMPDALSSVLHQWFTMAKRIKE